MGDFVRFLFGYFHESKPALGMMTLMGAVMVTMNWVHTLTSPNDVFVGHNTGRFTLHSENGWVQLMKSPFEDFMVRKSVLLFQLPYWSIVGSLIFLSAYLLLGKPRKTNQTKTTEPIPAEQV